jgi:hypothetical protein
MVINVTNTKVKVVIKNEEDTHTLKERREIDSKGSTKTKKR